MAAAFLIARGLSPAVAAAGAINPDRDQSTSQSRSSNSFSMLPYFFILGGFIGGMALAIDTTAGERERQSLEPLLANPVSRWQILAGKLGATTMFAIVTVLLYILAFGRSRTAHANRKNRHESANRPALCQLHGVRHVAAGGIAGNTANSQVAASAKSYREAQTYVSLLMFVPVIPTLLLTLTPIKAQFWMYCGAADGPAAPIITRLLRGDSVLASEMVLSFACSALAVALLSAITTHIYRSERLAISA